MPLNTDPGAVPDGDYFSGMQALADRVGDAGLHTVPDDVLAAAMDRAEARRGEDQ